MKFIHKHFFFFFLLCITNYNAQYITVNNNYTKEELVRDIFFKGVSSSCISIANVQVSGKDFGSGDISYGYFNKNGSTLAIDEGIILSTGSIKGAVGPNDFVQTEKSSFPFADASWGGDQDLIDILTQNGLDTKNILNATVLEFDFVSLKDSKIGFQYMFLSEEYRDDNCYYSDAFAFLIKKANTSDPYQNIAIVPGTTSLPVSTLTINDADGCKNNTDYFGSYNTYQSPTNFNGQTKLLTAKTNVVPGEKYHIKLVIADHGDSTGLYDSAVFLKAGSFTGLVDLGDDKLISNGTALCENSKLPLNVYTNTTATYQWYQNGIFVSNDPTYDITQPGDYQVIINDGGCLSQGNIKVEYAELPKFKQTSFDPCADTPNAAIKVKSKTLSQAILSNYKDYFDIQYYDSSGKLLPENWEYTQNETVQMQVKSGNCPVSIKTINFEYKTPRKSLLLQDKTICPNTTASLEAEHDFKHYKWMKENGDVIDEGDFVYLVKDLIPGKYVAELTDKNGCIYRQEVNILEAEKPIITHIDVNGSTVTVYVSGGTQPYSYSYDQGNFQSNNTFENVPRGLHKAFVKTNDQCYTIEKEFLLLNLVNVITPNGDGINDVLDFSDLRIKENVTIQIVDRFGQLVFLSDSGKLTWDGKQSGRLLPTGTYWYTIRWKEPDTGEIVTQKSWLMIKNRN